MQTIDAKHTPENTCYPYHPSYSIPVVTVQPSDTPKENAGRQGGPKEILDKILIADFFFILVRFRSEKGDHSSSPSCFRGSRVHEPFPSWSASQCSLSQLPSQHDCNPPQAALAALAIALGVNIATEDDTLAKLWLQLWPVLFQPAIGVLMAGALVSGGINWIREKTQN